MSINKTKQNKKVFVAISGGVDSSVVAALLKEQGYEVTGVHMLCWDECANNTDKQDAMRVAALLDIPFLVWDFREEYRTNVFNYMINEYKNGRTPNPDVMCNREIKFGIFLQRALQEGADSIATGHYVRHLEAKLPLGSLASKLGVARDENKDQSYFLWTLTQDQLKHSLFPVGVYLKSEVRALAKKFDLPTATKKDSQGLCFVGKVDFGDFLQSALSHTAKLGLAVNTTGVVIGEHKGAELYTIGQRHGLNISGSPEPLYIAEKNIDTNTLVVAPADDPALYRRELFARNVHWTLGVSPDVPFECLARIRYRQPLQEVTVDTSPPRDINLSSEGEVKVVFNEPQRAIASGQSVVFYKNDILLGGGIIA